MMNTRKYIVDEKCEKIEKYIRNICGSRAVVVLNEDGTGRNFVRIGGVCVMFELNPLLYNFSADYKFGVSENYETGLSLLKSDVDKAQLLINFLIKEFGN